MLLPEVLAFYQRGGERDRLAAGPGRLEYLRTWDILERTLPAAPAVVLDVGGATGAYAAPLAAAGYRVHVVDPVVAHVVEAAARPGLTGTVGDARALPVVAGCVDAVLLLGPLYHLPDRADRVTAWREAARVLRPGGVVVAAAISRYASLFAGLADDSYRDPRFRPIVEGALRDGRHVNAHADVPWLPTAYLHHPDELADEATEAGFVAPRRFLVEGPLALARDLVAEILADPRRTALLLEMMRDVEEEPALLGVGSHLLTVARRP